jgi:hypothetical protein
MRDQKLPPRRLDTKPIASRAFLVIENRAAAIERRLRDVFAIEDVPDVDFVIAQLDGIA